MAEHSEEQTKELATIFAKAYNQEHNTKFIWVDGKSYTAVKGGYHDFELFGKVRGDCLKIQLTRAAEAKPFEHARGNQTNHVVQKLKKHLIDADIKHISIFLNLHSPPKDLKTADFLAIEIARFIISKLDRRKFPIYFEFAHSDQWFIDMIKEWVGDLTVMPFPEHNGVHFGWATWEQQPVALLDDSQRIVGAVDKKINKYRDPGILILVDVDWHGVFDFYIPVMRQELNNRQINEVWFVENFTDNKRALRIK